MSVRLSRRSGSRFVAAVVALAASYAACAGVPGVPPSYGFNFATITHPGNAPAVWNFPQTGGPPLAVGRVDYAYRIATTEVTGAQWFQFVQAYAPFVESNAVNSATFKGNWGGVTFNGFIGGVPQYLLNPVRAGQPVDVGWRYAARFANWLHNGARTAGVATAADFATGAYDTSTFTVSPNPHFPGQFILNDQAVRSEGAKFFFPTFDEWVKAAYFDPDRYGPGQPGYWDYPITSDTAPVSGRPEFGGQTNSGPFPPGQTRSLDASMYPDVRSPWGLLDASGGLSEWLENKDFRGDRAVVGSTFMDPFGPTSFTDYRARTFGYSDVGGSFRGIRIASAVPSPSAFLAVCSPAFLLRRRRPCAPSGSDCPS